MTRVVIVAAMWTLFFVVLIRIRSRRNQSIVIAAGFIAASMTLNIESLYIAIDARLGGTNLLDFVGNGLLIAGAYFMAKAILVAIDPTQARQMARPYAIALAGTLAAMLVLFFAIERGPSTGAFMAEHGAQPAASAYSAVQYLFVGAVTLLTAVACFRAFPKMPAPTNRVAFLLLAIGSTFGIAVSVLVLIFDLTNVLTPEADVARRLSWFYDSLFAAAIVLMAAGLAMPPIGRRVYDGIRSMRARRMLARLQPIWDKTAAEQFVTAPVSRSTPVDHLLRAFIQVQDSLLRSPVLTDELMPDERRTLEDVDHFLQRS